MTYQAYQKRAQKIIDKYIALARQGKITENFGEKDYRKFKDLVNTDNALSYAEKATLCADLSHEIASINDNS